MRQKLMNQVTVLPLVSRRRRAVGPDLIPSYSDATDRHRDLACGSGLAGVGAVEVPVAGGLAVPAVVAARQHVDAADRALAAFLVAVEKVDRERPALGYRAPQPGAHRVVAVTDGAFPVPGVGRRDVQIDCEATEIRRVGVRAVGEGAIEHRVPPVQQGDSRAGGAQSPGQVNHIALALHPGPAPPTVGTVAGSRGGGGGAGARGPGRARAVGPPARAWAISSVGAANAWSLAARTSGLAPGRCR